MSETRNNDGGGKNILKSIRLPALTIALLAGAAACDSSGGVCFPHCDEAAPAVPQAVPAEVPAAVPAAQNAMPSLEYTKTLDWVQIDNDYSASKDYTSEGGGQLSYNLHDGAGDSLRVLTLSCAVDSPGIIAYEPGDYIDLFRQKTGFGFREDLHYWEFSPCQDGKLSEADASIAFDTVGE